MGKRLGQTDNGKPADATRDPVPTGGVCLSRSFYLNNSRSVMYTRSVSVGFALSDNRQPIIPLASTPSQDVASENRARLSLSRFGQVPLRWSRTASTGQIPRRRFVRDGEVPTVYRSRLPERPRVAAVTGEELAAFQSELAQERTAHAETEAVLKEARTVAASLETRLRHMELELQEMRAQAERAEQAAVLETEREPPIRTTRAGKPKAKRAKKEPQPMKWWLGK